MDLDFEVFRGWSFNDCGLAYPEYPEPDLISIPDSTHTSDSESEFDPDNNVELCAEDERQADAEAESDLEPDPSDPPTIHATASTRAQGPGLPIPDSDPKARQAPSLEAAKAALADITVLLRPPRNGYGYKEANLDHILQERLEGMRRLLCIYTAEASSTHSHHGKQTGQTHWIVASLEVAKAEGLGPWHARCVRRRTQAYIRNRSDLPRNLYGTWARSQLDDEDFRQEVFLHLQGIGEYVKAEDLVHYLDRADVKEQWNTKKTISLATAQ